jgi:hypothetical protein
MGILYEKFVIDFIETLTFSIQKIPQLISAIPSFFPITFQ